MLKSKYTLKEKFDMMFKSTVDCLNSARELNRKTVSPPAEKEYRAQDSIDCCFEDMEQGLAIVSELIEELGKLEYRAAASKILLKVSGIEKT